MVLSSLFFPDFAALAPYTDLLEIVFFASALIFASQNFETRNLLFWALIVFLVSRVAWAILIKVSPIEEVFRAHKWLLYLTVMFFFVGRMWSNSKLVTSLVRLLVIGMLVKYAAIKLLEGSEARPQVLTENNYEIALVSGLIVVFYDKFGKARFLYYASYAITVAMSGSRSGTVAMAVVTIYLLWKFPFKEALTRYLALIGMTIPFLIVLSTFESRIRNGADVDRLNFLGQFFYNTSNWDLWNWLLGTEPISLLAPETCSALSYYSELLTSDGSGNCYSVILHMFVVRAVFDTGFTGLALVFVALWVALQSGQVDKPLSFVLIVLGSVNSLSVSGFNNIYVMLPFAFALLNASSSKSKVASPQWPYSAIPYRRSPASPRPGTM